MEIRDYKTHLIVYSCVSCRSFASFLLLFLPFLIESMHAIYDVRGLTLSSFLRIYHSSLYHLSAYLRFKWAKQFYKKTDLILAAQRLNTPNLNQKLKVIQNLMFHNAIEINA